MMIMPEIPDYYKPSLPKSLRVEMEKLFEKREDIRNYFDNNKVKFIEAAIRNHLVYWEEFTPKKD